MKWKKLTLLLLLVNYCFYWSIAQNNFIEGELVYSVSIESNNAEAGKINSTGHLTLWLKGNSVVKMLELNKGYKNIIIFNGTQKSTHSLRSIGDKKIALLLAPNLLTKKLERCSTLRVEELEIDTKTILNFKTERARIHCNNSSPVVVYYTKEWHINNPYLFDDFPSFSHLPLLFDIKNEDGSIFHFELKKIEAKPMDNSVFDIPNEYKIITSEEYNKWQH